MKVVCKKNGPHLMASLSGELDHHGAEQVRKKLTGALEDSRVKILTLDLGGVTFMDSSGIGVILGRYKTIHARGGKLMIENPSEQVQRILKMAGINKLVG